MRKRRSECVGCLHNMSSISVLKSWYVQFEILQTLVEDILVLEERGQGPNIFLI